MTRQRLRFDDLCSAEFSEAMKKADDDLVSEFSEAMKKAGGDR